MTEIKDTITFDDIFIPKIREGLKILTLRNSPVTLGVKQIRDDLKIEVYSCKKVGLYYHYNIGMILYTGYSPYLPMNNYINYFGFDTEKEILDFYNHYLKRDWAYLIGFKVIDGEPHTLNHELYGKSAAVFLDDFIIKIGIKNIDTETAITKYRHQNYRDLEYKNKKNRKLFWKK